MLIYAKYLKVKKSFIHKITKYDSSIMKKLFHFILTSKIRVHISGSWIGNDESETSGELHRAGIKIVSIGLGKHFNLAQLYVMASQTKDDHVFTVDFPQIPNIVWAIQDTLYIG